MLPAIYLSATARNVTPVCPARQQLGLGFDLPDGSVLRISLDAASVELLRQSLADYSSAFAGTQLPGSRLMPSEPMSVPSEGEKV